MANARFRNTVQRSIAKVAPKPTKTAPMTGSIFIGRDVDSVFAFIGSRRQAPREQTKYDRDASEEAPKPREAFGVSDSCGIREVTKRREPCNCDSQADGRKDNGGNHRGSQRKLHACAGSLLRMFAHAHDRWTSMATPMTMSMSGHHCRKRGPSCGITPRLDRRKSTPTKIKTNAPVRDLKSIVRSPEWLGHRRILTAQIARPTIPGSMKIRSQTLFVEK